MRDILSGPVDSGKNSTSARPNYLSWLDDRTWAYAHLEGGFRQAIRFLPEAIGGEHTHESCAVGDVPLNLDPEVRGLGLPRLAGIIIDAIRAANIAKVPAASCCPPRGT